MTRLGRCLVAVGCLIGGLSPAGALRATPAGASSTVTSFVFVSAPGDVLGGGATAAFSPPAATFAPFGTFGDAAVQITSGPPGDRIMWTVELSPPLGSQLLPGSYSNAVTAPNPTQGHPGLYVSGDDRSCNTVSGSFVVNSIQFDALGSLTELDATFVQHCDAPSAPPLTGSVKYQAPSAAPVLLDNTTPSTVVGERATFAARVAPNGTAPTGTVAFLDGATTLGSSPLKAGGIALFTTSSLRAGVHDITARYSGDGAHPSGSSATQTQTVIANGTSYWILSTSGDFVGAGAQAYYAPVNANIDLTGTIRSPGFMVSISTGSWFIQFGPATGQHLHTGYFPNALPSADATHPKLSVFGNGADCASVGAFTISSLTTDVFGDVTAVTATFVQSCTGPFPEPLFGTVHWHE